MTINSKSNLPIRTLKTKTMPRYNKVHMFYLVTTMMVLIGVVIATSFKF